MLSTTFVSPTRLIATITVAADASIDLYDISVINRDRKKGIGYSRFEITQAFVANGMASLHGANAAGDMTGSAPGIAYFNPLSGVELIDPSGGGWAIDPSGTQIVGSGPNLWQKVGGSWQATVLPAASSARFSSLAVDPETNQVRFIGGLETVPMGKHSSTQLPGIWAWRSATSDWARTSLPIGTGTKGDVLGVSRTGVAAGWIVTSNFQASVWEPSGGGYTLITLAPVGSRAMGINSDGTLIVGASGGFAAYWTKSAGVWSGPVTLPGGCGIARAVDDSGRIVANSCPIGNRTSPVVFLPPYTASASIRLGGLGPTNSGYVEGMSLTGGYVVGYADSPNASAGGLYWHIPCPLLDVSDPGRLRVRKKD